MRFDEVVLAIMKAVDGQRTVSSPYHLIKGKKSGQTIQDIGYFKLHPYFAVLPKLDKQDYLASIDRLQAQGFLIPNDNKVQLHGSAFALEIPPAPLNGWKYRGNENRFFSRLSLVVQTMSNFMQGQKRFDPVVTDETVQAWAKAYLKRIDFRSSAVQKAFKNQLENSLALAKTSEVHKAILMERLSGCGVGGLTWDQLAMEHGLLPIDVKIAAVEALHAWLDVLEGMEYPLLAGMLEGIIQQSALTESAKRTQNLSERGFSLQQIAELRQLKTSTIEDHFVEMAMNDPAFSSAPFMDEQLFQSIHHISKELKTMRLRDIKERLPEASYFQIRLALAMRGGFT
ncbi:helix-turn-helix domain-containing protein [Planococcus sp. CP5-4]|uniref:helix-turn-helix domain-containing protein n=1 Tax=unclassified Planococcus (in: firmicutes) TaxID=2662419 RepID=UPI001C21E15D|nr:helix-turn-helix domain-containing protein [Planococcus sp. CP5-4]MBU9671987.1 helix-turn-helix domain-containing protein [Planococcus sp. CP5-4_YE]MBV0907550.1 helix-turn-helix domain-containing protein [Planococcus sp. CP5-4_UN]MBW6062717.1 helix-turn-helix domain-containing protein [Planococcus sp. CP5-4]